MELRHLRTIDAVARHRSFTKAAEELFLAQSAISQQIRRLEKEIGIQIFRRSSRSVELTDEGRIILEHAKVPVIVDAGVGVASDAAIAMELGCHGVLMNTAVAGAKNPVLMAEAMREAVSAGRKAFLAGRMPKRLYANASSPEAGLIE